MVLGKLGRRFSRRHLRRHLRRRDYHDGRDLWTKRSEKRCESRGSIWKSARQSREKSRTGDSYHSKRFSSGAHLGSKSLRIPIQTSVDRGVIFNLFSVRHCKRTNEK